MRPILGCCGYRCDLCPAYRANVRGPADQQRVSDGWHTYHGFRLPAEKIACDGCRDGRPDAVRIDRNCPVRACARERGWPTCAGCPEFGCSRLRSRRVTRAAIEARCGATMPHDDVAAFVLPYLGWARLQRLKAEAAGPDSPASGEAGR